jgi:hypothetical protein
MPHFGNRECFENCLEDKAEWCLEWGIWWQHSRNDHSSIKQGSQSSQAESNCSDDMVYCPEVNGQGCRKQQQREPQKQGKDLHDKVKPPLTHPIEFTLSFSTPLCNCPSFTNRVVVQEPLLSKHGQKCSHKCSKQAEIEETLCDHHRWYRCLRGWDARRQEGWRQTSYVLH